MLANRLFAALLGLAAAGTAPASDALPAEVVAALQRARIPIEALSVLVQEAGGTRTLLQHQPQLPLNPASVIKLLTTAAALDQLGPAWTWSTPVWLHGKLDGGVLDGNVHIKGSGDPKLVYERVWLLLRRVMQLGVRELRGDFVLDASAFAPPDGAAADFDGQGQRAYNVRASALLLNYHAQVYTFSPDPAAGVARVASEPPLAGLAVDRSVPLSNGPCDDWAARLKASFTPARTRFAGSYALACGEQSWPLADASPETFNRRLVEGLWREMGGKLTGSVREGPAPVDARPTFEQRSPPLIEVVREINKFSNNVMAQQLFLTLALQRNPGQPATPEAAREGLRRWVVERLGEVPGEGALVIPNGSGLARETRISAQLLARVLQYAWASPWMSELMSSLPIAGVDGTLRRARAGTGRAHLKTGSLRDASSRAGWVSAGDGRRYVLVATINHPNAGIAATRPVFDALLEWVLERGAAQNLK
jgi:D-alanyl-D-alanine carboxypeptidase/D-alanyl-D-alanine-endopeptidase (penicillin-binding protein 4)